MKQYNKDLFLILTVAIMNMIWSCFPTHFALMSIILALPLVFLAPGYLLIELLTQKREHDGITHLLLSIGLSISIDILGGFLLNVIPIGLTALTWVIFLSALTIACMLLCMVKRRRWQIYGDRKQRDLPTRYEFPLLTMTIYVVIFAFLYTNNIIIEQQYKGFTQFWLLLDDHESHICIIQLGIENREIITTTYQIELKKNNQHAAHWSSITLVPQQRWQGQLPIAISDAQTTPLSVEADLYRQQEPNSVYRAVRLPLSSSKITCTQYLSMS